MNTRPRRFVLRPVFVGLVVLISSLVPALDPTEATTLTVGTGGFSTIQAGIDAAASGDTVLV
ncbi:MAG TPA: hypothetical protein VFP10_04195, partial [Candidatus Eisenbacteria bacterium]|nr:hypothetical protein [Candidatus Eisenbacteria bacterium]